MRDLPTQPFVTLQLDSAVGRGNKGIAVRTSYVCGITFVSTDFDLVKSAVVFCFAVVGTADDTAFNTSVFVVSVHRLILPLRYVYIVRTFSFRKTRKNMEKMRVLLYTLFVDSIKNGPFVTTVH